MYVRKVASDGVCGKDIETSSKQELMDSFSRLFLLHEIIIALDTCVSFVVVTDQFKRWNLSDCLAQVSFLLKVEHERSGRWRGTDFEDFVLLAIEYAASDFAVIQGPLHALPLCCI